MKFVCEKAVLASAVLAASRVASPKSSIPALEGILVRAGEDVRLTGYNLETGISVSVPADIAEGGECVMPARLFSEIVRCLPDDQVSVTVSDDLQVSIRCGDTSSQFTALDAEDYPELPEVEYENAVSLPQRALKELISGTIFSVADNQTRPVHTGCLFEVEDTSVTVVAIDGYRLALRRYRPEEPIGREMKFVAPAAALKEVEKNLADVDEPAKFMIDANYILFEIGDATLVCRLLEGEFLDWRRVVPTDNPIKLTANVPRLMSCINFVGLMVSEKVKSPVRCRFGENRGDFRTMTAVGAAHDVCPLAGDGKDLEIGFNCRYLLDALRAVPAEEVTLELSNGLSPVVLTPTDGTDGYAYMILPVRLKDN